MKRRALPDLGRVARHGRDDRIFVIATEDSSWLPRTIWSSMRSSLSGSAVAQESEPYPNRTRTVPEPYPNRTRSKSMEAG